MGANRLFLDTTSAALLTAASGTALRQQVIAANLANAETPGYRARGVDFESALAAALQSEQRSGALAADLGADDTADLTGADGLGDGDAIDTPTAFAAGDDSLAGASVPDDSPLDDVHPTVVADPTPPLRWDGNNVDAEQQLVALAQSSLQHEAVVRLLAQKFAMLKMAIGGSQG